MARLVVMISGSGTNLQTLMNAVTDGRLDVEIVLVVSNRKAAYGLTRAEQAGIPTLYFPLKPYRDVNKTRTEYDADLAEEVLAYSPDLIVQVGWMHILSHAFLDHFPGRIINLHPALPGEFAGVDAIVRAYDAYRRGEITKTGCMVHYVVPEVDAGPVIAQSIVPIYPGDRLEDLQARVHEAEHKLIVDAVQQALASIAR